jgi:YesN/AraC family two-component response regulator
MPPVSRPHLLVVDDEACVREALTAAFADRYVVHAAASGAEACAILRAHPVDVIILDAVLQNEHGLDLVERFRRLSLAQIVILTGHGTEDLAVQALRARVTEYLKKPASLTDLQAVLDRLVPREHRASELVARACRHLDEYPPKAFRAGDLAGQLGVSEGYLRRLFREVCGQTPRQYLTEVRIRRAAHLLRMTDGSVKRIALEVGCGNTRLFRRVFTRAIGMPPQVWRRRGRAAAKEVKAAGS